MINLKLDSNLRSLCSWNTNCNTWTFRRQWERDRTSGVLAISKNLL